MGVIRSDVDHGKLECAYTDRYTLELAYAM